MYNFKKVKIPSDSDSSIVYQNPYFLRDKPELMVHIDRKVRKNQALDMSKPNSSNDKCMTSQDIEQVNSLKQDITSLQKKVDKLIAVNQKCLNKEKMQTETIKERVSKTEMLYKRLIKIKESNNLENCNENLIQDIQNLITTLLSKRESRNSAVNKSDFEFSDSLHKHQSLLSSKKHEDDFDTNYLANGQDFSYCKDASLGMFSMLNEKRVLDEPEFISNDCIISAEYDNEDINFTTLNDNPHQHSFEIKSNNANENAHQFNDICFDNEQSEL